MIINSSVLLVLGASSISLYRSPKSCRFSIDKTPCKPPRLLPTTRSVPRDQRWMWSAAGCHVCGGEHSFQANWRLSNQDLVKTRSCGSGENECGTGLEGRRRAPTGSQNKDSNYSRTKISLLFLMRFGWINRRDVRPPRPALPISRPASKNSWSCGSLDAEDNPTP